MVMKKWEAMQQIVDKQLEDITTLNRRIDYLRNKWEEVQVNFIAICEEREWLRKSLNAANEARDYWKNKCEELNKNNTTVDK